MRGAFFCDSKVVYASMPGNGQWAYTPIPIS